MPGTKAGAAKARETMKQLYGEDVYRDMGRKGGKARVPKGFAKMDKERLVEVSKRGGRGDAINY